MRELEREDRVAGLEHGQVHGHVRLGAGVRLDVRVLGAEQLLRPIDRSLLDLVHDLAAAVVAAARVPLGVLVRRNRPDRLEHGRPGEVLGGDQLDLAALALELAAEQLGDRGIDLGQPRGAEVLHRLLRDCHRLSSDRISRECYSCRRRRARSIASVAGTAPSRRTRGSSPVRSSTVEGVPGKLAGVDDRRRAGADLDRHVLQHGAGRARRGGWRSWPRPRPPARRSRRAKPVSSGTRTRCGPEWRPSSTGSARPGSGGRACTRPGSSARTIAPERPRSSGTHSKRRSMSRATSAIGCSGGVPFMR